MSANTGKTVIDLQHLRFAYGAAPVLEDVDLMVSQGEFLGLVGPNAGGKSTLLKLVLGLLEPQGGRILVLGQTLAAHANASATCRNIRPFRGTSPLASRTWC